LELNNRKTKILKVLNDAIASVNETEKLIEISTAATTTAAVVSSSFNTTPPHQSPSFLSSFPPSFPLLSLSVSQIAFNPNCISLTPHWVQFHSLFSLCLNPNQQGQTTVLI
jgi:hypothetical protein